MKNFTKNVISNFDIGDNGTRVGIIRYASRASIILSLGSINNANGLNTFIDSIWYTRGGTATHSALNELPAAFNTSRTDQGIPRVAIVFTDGQSNSRTLTAKAAQSVHDTGIIVYSIGIGSGVNTNELNTIAIVVPAMSFSLVVSLQVTLLKYCFLYVQQLVQVSLLNYV